MEGAESNNGGLIYSIINIYHTSFQIEVDSGRTQHLGTTFRWLPLENEVRTMKARSKNGHTKDDRRSAKSFGR
jgi:hypothetical protein